MFFLDACMPVGALARSDKVQDAYYSIPEGTPALPYRSGEQQCDQDRYCVAGLAYNCSRTYCWPQPNNVTAREALPGESYNGTDYYSIRFPGLTTGDVIEIHFDENGTMPQVNSSELVLRLINFTVPLGRDGYEFVGRWVTPSLLFMTVTKGSWNISGVTDPLYTRVGNLSFTISQAANLR